MRFIIQPSFCRTYKKNFMIMKLLVLCLTLSIFNTAGTVYSQKLFDLDFANISVGEALREIESTSNYKFLYRTDLIDLNRKVNLQVTGTYVEDLLTMIFPSDDASFRIFEDNLIAITRSGLHAQQFEVRGRVTDAGTGEPLPGVNIIIEGTTMGTITDFNGNYTLVINVPDAVIVYSFVGYVARRIVPGDQRTINVQLNADLAELDEVVVVGYGTQRRREVTSSIATVREDGFNQGAVSSSPLQLVQGKIAGLAISRAHGGDPTRDVHMLLRGVSTVRGDLSPLIIIDGVPGGNLNTISPEDIESIDVLRDGSAAAIYGTRGNAGVIIISTKKGTPGRPAVAYSGYTYTENWSNKPQVLNAAEWKKIKVDFENSGNPLLVGRANSIVDYGQDTDWMNEITRSNPISYVHNLSISGGGETTSYFASVNYRDLQGFIAESNNNMLNGRLSLTHTGLGDKLILQMNLSNSLRKANPVDYQVYRQAIGRNPTLPVYNDDGSFFEIPGWEVRNPVAMLKQYDRNEERSDLLANTQVTLEVARGLRVSVMGAMQRANDLTGIYESRYSLNSVMGGYNGSASRRARQWEDRTFESTLNYSGRLSGVHGLTALAGYSYQDFTYEAFGAGNRYFITDAFSYNNLGAGLHVPEGNFQSNDIWSTKNSSKLIAFFGRVNYNYDDRYMLSASLRNEGSSRFGRDHKWGMFPAISAGWAISQEDFMSNALFINDLRLRAGFGITGNQGIGNYISLQRLGSSGVMLYDGKWIPGFAPASNPNPNLRWERKAETNIGLDVTMFNNLTLNFDVYDRRTTDLLYEYSVPVPPNLYNSLWTNVGEISNKGVEMTVSARPMATQNFSWRTNFNISYNKNELVSLSSDEFKHSHLDHTNLGAPGLNETPVFRLEEGQPLGNFFGWRHAGFTEDGKWLFWNADKTEKLRSSQVGIEDKAVIGNGLPKSWLGFTNVFTYNNFDLNIALRGALFFDLVNSRRIFYENVIMMPTNVMASAIGSPLVDDPQFSDYYVERGDYLKLDNITLGYNIPVRNEAFRQIRVYVSGQNLHTFTAYKGQDPEIGIEGLSPGMDYRWIYPSVKTFTFGVNVQF
jgi:TonB-dependent starch-binding outer membrane protein SusC